MTSITFDTLASAKRMKAKGVKPEDAEAFAEELRVTSETDVSHLATKDELSGFKSELKADLRELEAKMQNVESRLEAKIAESKAEVIKWMFGGFATIVGLLAAILFKLH